MLSGGVYASDLGHAATLATPPSSTLTGLAVTSHNQRANRASRSVHLP